MTSNWRNTNAAQTFYTRALRSEGVHLFEPTKAGGSVHGLIGGGEMRVTGSRGMKYVLDQWSKIDDPATGWNGLAFRAWGSGRPLVVMSTICHARILAMTEEMAAASGRFPGKQ